METKPIPGFPGYFASSDGFIFCNRPFSPRPVNPVALRRLKGSTYDKWGHLNVVLRREGKGYTRNVHRLILETFTGPRPKGKEYRHFDGVAWHNRINNLFWGTRLENARDAVRHGTVSHGEGHYACKFSNSTIAAVRKSTRSQRVIAARFGMSRSYVSQLQNHRRRKSYGM